MGADNVVVAGIVIGLPLENRFPDQSLIQNLTVSTQALPGDIHEERGETLRIHKAGTGNDSLNKQPPGIVLKPGARGWTALSSVVHDLRILASVPARFNRFAILRNWSHPTAVSPAPHML